MEAKIKIPLIATMMAGVIYLIVYISHGAIADVSSNFSFLPWEISRAYDIPMTFPLFFIMTFFIMYLKNLESDNIRLRALIGWGLLLSIILGTIIGIQINPISGMITSLTLCFIFGLFTTRDFSVLVALSFGLLFWVIAAIKTGLVLGAIPGIMAAAIFGSVSFFGFWVKTILSPKKIKI